MELMREITRDIVAAHIFSKDGKLFQGQKDPHGGGVYLDCWHIPGGGIEEGEDKLTALVREVQEETGIDAKDMQITLVNDTVRGSSEKTLPNGERVLCHMTFTTYQIDLPTIAAETEITLNDDLVAYRWSELDELKNLKLTPPSTELFGLLGWL